MKPNLLNLILGVSLLFVAAACSESPNVASEEINTEYSMESGDVLSAKPHDSDEDGIPSNKDNYLSLTLRSWSS